MIFLTSFHVDVKVIAEVSSKSCLKCSLLLVSASMCSLKASSLFPTRIQIPGDLSVSSPVSDQDTSEEWSHIRQKSLEILDSFFLVCAVLSLGLFLCLFWMSLNLSRSQGLPHAACLSSSFFWVQILGYFSMYCLKRSSLMDELSTAL